MRVGIACGGYSSEAEISKKSAAVVFEHLHNNGIEVYYLFISSSAWTVGDASGAKMPFDTASFQWKDGDQLKHFDVIFNAVHGPPGEDGDLAKKLAQLGLPHTSCGPDAAALTYNKINCLKAAKELGIPTAKSVTLTRPTATVMDRIVAEIGFPCFVKANQAGSSYGVYRVDAAGELPSAIAGALEEDQQVLVEQALIGRECSVGVVQLLDKIEVLPITEIKTAEAFFTYQAKYEGKAEEITPAEFTPEVTKTLSQHALLLFKALKLEGVVRFDFIVVDNIPFLLEINSVPGLTAASIIPQQWGCTQRPLFELFHGMLQTALNKK